MKISMLVVKRHSLRGTYERRVYPFVSREEAERRQRFEHGWTPCSTNIVEVSMFPWPYLVVKVTRRFPHPIKEFTAKHPWMQCDTDGSTCTEFIEGWSTPRHLDDFQRADRLISLNPQTFELTDEYTNEREYTAEQARLKRAQEAKQKAFWDPSSGAPKPEDPSICHGYVWDTCKMFDLMGHRCAACDRAYENHRWWADVKERAWWGHR